MTNTTSGSEKNVPTIRDMVNTTVGANQEKDSRPWKGMPASEIRDIDDYTVRLHSTTPIPRPIHVGTDFWEVLRKFPNQSLWDTFQCDGDGKLIHHVGISVQEVSRKNSIFPFLN